MCAISSHCLRLWNPGGVKLPNQQGASDLQPEGHRKGDTSQQQGTALLRLPLPGWTGREHRVTCEASCMPVGARTSETRRNRLRMTRTGEGFWPKEEDSTKRSYDLAGRRSSSQTCQSSWARHCSQGKSPFVWGHRGSRRHPAVLSRSSSEKESEDTPAPDSPLSIKEPC